VRLLDVKWTVGGDYTRYNLKIMRLELLFSKESGRKNDKIKKK
jgi:hypothetical protein